MVILHIDSSILGDASVTRALSAAIVERQQALRPGAQVIYRDLAAADAPSGDSDLADLLAADLIVIGAPMYNFSIPAQLKAWIDRVVVAGKTFRYGEAGPEGLLTHRRLFIASARGGIYSGESPARSLDHHETYLKSVLGFIGLNDITILRAEGLALGDAMRASAIAEAHAAVAALAA